MTQIDEQRSTTASKGPTKRTLGCLTAWGRASNASDVEAAVRRAKAVLTKEELVVFRAEAGAFAALVLNDILKRRDETVGERLMLAGIDLGPEQKALLRLWLVQQRATAREFGVPFQAWYTELLARAGRPTSRAENGQDGRADDSRRVEAPQIEKTMKLLGRTVASGPGAAPKQSTSQSSGDEPHPPSGASWLKARARTPMGSSMGSKAKAGT